MNEQYEKLATRARELLSVRPRPATEDVAARMLIEISDEFEVAAWLRGRFIDRLKPALVGLVASVRARLVREIEEEAARGLLAKPLPNAGLSASASSEPKRDAPTPALGAGDGHSGHEAHARPATPAPEPGVPDASDTQQANGTPTPASGGQTGNGIHTPDAAQPESGRTDGDQHDLGAQTHHVAPSAPEWAGDLAEPRAFAPAPERAGDDEAAKSAANSILVSPPVSPLSLRAEVLDGYRALRDELLYVPEFPDVTYGSATAERQGPAGRLAPRGAQGPLLRHPLPRAHVARRARRGQGVPGRRTPQRRAAPSPQQRARPRPARRLPAHPESWKVKLRWLLAAVVIGVLVWVALGGGIGWLLAGSMGGGR